MKVLVIDDDNLIRESTEEVLRRMGHLVVSAGDGETGLELAKTEQPDRIVCDHDMPGLTGTEVYERLPPELQERMWLWSASLRLNFPRPDRVIAKPCTVKQMLLRAGIR